MMKQPERLDIYDKCKNIYLQGVLDLKRRTSPNEMFGKFCAIDKFVFLFQL